MAGFTSVTIIPTLLPVLGSFRLDAARTVSRSHPGQVFRHAIQSGREGITDAVHIDPDVLSVSGIITDFPVELGAIATLPERAARMYDLLQKMRELRQPLTVITSWTGLLANRWISSFDVSRNQTTGKAIEISMTIDKLNIVSLIMAPQELDADIALLGMSTVSVGF